MKSNMTMILKSLQNCALGLLILALAMSAASTTISAQPQQYALLVAIGKYPPESGWQQINSPNDIAVMREVLLSRGFLPENIISIQDEQATRQGILNTWKAQLLPRVKPGDVVYFQYSGHGQQVADDNGDEIDGYDEAIVPFDSPLRYKAGVYQGENLIRDDQLDTLLTDLRQRLGAKGNVMVVIDACHSGTSTRGMGPARGTIVQMASPEYAAAAAKRPNEGLASKQFDGVRPDASGLAPMAAFFGSAQNQLNFETTDEHGQFIGPMTYALSKKLSTAPKSVTYRGLFEQVRIQMNATAPRQQPQAEGTLDQEILGGQLLEKPAYFHVLRWNDAGSVVVDAGWAHGLNEGAVLGLYAPETRDPEKAKPLARGTVSNVLPFEATLTLDADLKQSDARDAWVYILEQNLGDLHLGLSIQLAEGSPIRTALEEKLKKYPVIRTSDTPELYLTQTGANIQLIGQGDMALGTLSASTPPAAGADQLLRRMLGYAQAKYLRKMDMKSDAFDLSLELIPLRPDPQAPGKYDPVKADTKRDAAGALHFQKNDKFKIRVTNNGEKAAYFTIIDIQPNNEFTIIVPDKDETPSEFRVGAGQTVEVPKRFGIGPPEGLETFKLIASEKPVDLRPMAQTRGVATRANTQLNPLEKLFGQTYFNDDVLRRGGNTTNMAAGSIDVNTLTFIID